ncbi:MAG TPA: DUF1800 family protein [Chitinophagaceae bacterium]|nr:DUF1800 family protein [Chitinophagaceae bacterium]
MEKKISRKAFLSTATKTAATNNEKDPVDPFVKKYGNRQLPFNSALRTSSGLTPYTGAWTEAEVYHLLRRATFGLTQDSVAALKQFSGAAEAVDYLLNIKQYPQTSPVNCYNYDYYDNQGCPFGYSWVFWASPESGDPTLAYYRTDFSFKPWWIGEMIGQNTDLLEKMALFWGNHFGTRTYEFNDPKAVWQHFNTLRLHALGNFRDIIKLITIDPHMLNVLNGNLSTARAPDENYARELQELFTVGKGPNSQYTEEDVKQAARVLTGWRRQQQNDGTFITYFSDADHDSSNKHFSAFYNHTVINGQTGVNGQYETDALLDMILATDEAAKYICRCLYRWFVYYVIGDAEEQNVITPLAAIMRNNNYELAPVLRALFTSEHFFDQLNRGCIIKSPIDLYIGMARSIGVNIPTEDVLYKYKFWNHFKMRCDEIGQHLADPVDISGWPAYRQEPLFYEAWINSTTIQIRAKTLNMYATMGYEVQPFSLTRVKIDSIGFCKKFPDPATPNTLINDISRYLLPSGASAKQFDAMKTKLIKNLEDDSYWTRAWYAYLANPGDPIAEGTVRQRLDDLLGYIMNLEEYQLY